MLEDNNCQAITKDGNHCKNPAKTNGYCHIGAHKAQGSTAAAVKNLVEAFTESPTTKEEKMEIFHYLYTKGDDCVTMRVITNNPTPAQREAVELSRLGNRVTNIRGTSARVLHIDTGKWSFPLLAYRANEQGVKFTAVSYDINVIKEMEDEEIHGLIQRSHFAWATASNAIFIKFEGHDGFNLDPLGLKVKNHKKLSKRLTEILRCTGHFFIGDVRVREFTTPEGHEDIFYDGGNVISRAFAKKMGFTGDRGNIRVLTPIGLIKGDCQVVDDLDVDILFHTENLKDELSTTDWTMATIMSHDPYHELRHDDQTRANFSFFIPEEAVREDLIRMVKDWKTSVQEAGDLYDYLDSSQNAFDDPIAVDIDFIQMHHRLEDQAEALKEVGIAPASFSNIVYTRCGAMSRKMNAHRMYSDAGKPLTSFKRMFIPATNAFVGSVSTWEFCTEMCGMEFPDEDGTRTFWDDRIGLVIPGQRFADTYDLHGGHDGDDTWSMYDIKVFCSDDDKLDRLIDTDVIDPNLVVGRTEDEAVRCGLAIRRPNGPGEYSIESVSEEMPYAFADEDRVPTVDLANAPESQSTVFSRVKMGEIPTSVSYDRPFDRAFALSMVEAQKVNPGVGPFANVIIAIASTFGPDNMPPEMLAAMEDIIDSVQQTADEVAFSAISEETNRLWMYFYEKVMDEGVKVDSGLLATRVPTLLGTGEDAIAVVENIRNAGLSVEGPQRRLHKLYVKAVDRVSEVGRTAANDARLKTPLGRYMVNYSIGAPRIKEWADGFLASMNPRLRRVAPVTGEDMNPIERRANQTARRLELESFMDDVVESITSNDRFDTHDQVLALYKVMIKTGDNDRLFVQPSTAGKDSMLGLFVQACESKGILLGLLEVKLDDELTDLERRMKALVAQS